MYRKTAENIQEFKHQATRFFISILTNLTFKSIRVDDRNNELNNFIMGFMLFNEKKRSDKDKMILFAEDGVDPSPAFRTYLLQLLIRHRFVSLILSTVDIGYSDILSLGMFPRLHDTHT